MNYKKKIIVHFEKAKCFQLFNKISWCEHGDSHKCWHTLRMSDPYLANTPPWSLLISNSFIALTAACRYLGLDVTRYARTNKDMAWPWAMAEYQPGGNSITSGNSFRATLSAQVIYIADEHSSWKKHTDFLLYTMVNFMTSINRKFPSL